MGIDYDTAKRWEAEAQRILDKIYRIAYKDLKWS